MADAGYRLTVDGEAEFKRALADINSQIKLNKSELNALTAEYNANGGSLDTLKAKQAALGTEMANQQQKVDLMRQRLEEAKAAYGENSAQVVKLQTDLNNAAGALATMQKQYNDTAKQIEDATHSTADFDEAVKAADAAIAAEKAELANISAAYKDSADKAGNLAEQNKSLTAQVEAQQKKVEALSAAMKTAADRFGEDSAEAQKYREQLAKAEGELGKTKDALDKTTKAMEDQSGASGGLMDGLKGLADQFGVQLPAGMDKLLGGFSNLLGPAGIAGLVAGVGEAIQQIHALADETAGMAAELVDLSEKTGANTDELQALHYVAKMLGVETGAVDKAMENLSKKMYEAKTKGGEAQKMFDDLGISLMDDEGNMRSTTDVMLDLIDALKQYERGAERTAAADKLMGGAAQELTSLLSESGDRIRAYMREYVDNMGAMTDELVSILDKRDKMLAREEAAAQNLRRSMGVNAAVAFNSSQAVRDQASQEAGKAFVNWVETFLQRIRGAYARGTSYHPGGLALVGEQGPEIVDLPQGSKVYPTGTGPAGTTNNYYEITIDASRIRELQDIVRIAENERVSRRMGAAK